MELKSFGERFRMWDFMNGSSIALSCGKSVEEPKRPMNMSAIWFVEGSVSSSGLFIGGMVEKLSLSLPIMAFMKDHVVLWPSLGSRLLMNVDRACFF